MPIEISLLFEIRMTLRTHKASGLGPGAERGVNGRSVIVLVALSVVVIVRNVVTVRITKCILTAASVGDLVHFWVVLAVVTTQGMDHSVGETTWNTPIRLRQRQWSGYGARFGAIIGGVLCDGV